MSNKAEGQIFKEIVKMTKTAKWKIGLFSNVYESTLSAIRTGSKSCLQTADKGPSYSDTTSRIEKR